MTSRNRICAYGNSGEQTCYTLGNLRVIAKEYNKHHVDKIPLPSTKNKLLEDIRSRMREECNLDETCWLKAIRNQGKRKSIDLSTFKPEIQRYSELSGADIEYVMTQYQKGHKEFAFLNAVPSNIYVPKVMSRYVKKPHAKKKIGVVLNTLPDGTEGEHWVTVFIDKDKRTFEYYDPVGNRPNSDIHRSLEALKEFLSLKNYTYLENSTEHQPPDNNIDCGVYGLLFIDERLKGKSFEEIVEGSLVPKREKFFRMKSVS